MAPFLAWGTMYGYIGFSEALRVKPRSFVKGRFVFALTVFYISIALFYKAVIGLSPLFELLKEFLFSAFLGVIWTFVFLQIIKAFKLGFKSPRKIYLWFMFSITAFGVYVLIR